MDKPLVTVICITYNHAPYIRDALEGFLAQQTRFPVEILVHDDASTDGTADIVRDYAQRYPDRIHPIFQQENQFSKGVSPVPTFCFPLVRGKYVALCEGDDHWTDPAKLQRQVEALEKHPEADLCAHCARRTRNGRPAGFMAPRIRNCIIPVEEVVKGIPLATASLLCRADVYLQTSPMREVVFLDFSLQLQAAIRGGIVYLSRCMSEYRIGTAGSWSSTYRGARRMDARQLVRQILDAFDSWTEKRYHAAVRWRLAKLDTGDLITQHRYLELLSPRWLPWSLSRLGRSTLRLLRTLYCYIRWISM